MMRYFLATYEILDGEHEHTGAVIFEAETKGGAEKLAKAEEFDTETDTPAFYFSYDGDGMTVCRNSHCQEITEEQMNFLEKVGLAYRR